MRINDHISVARLSWPRFVMIRVLCSCWRDFVDDDMCVSEGRGDDEIEDSGAPVCTGTEGGMGFGDDVDGYCRVLRAKAG